MKRCVTSALVALPLLTLAPVTPATALPASDQTEAAKAYAITAHAATNEERIQRHLGALGKNQCLRRVALAQARSIAASGELVHQDLAKVQRKCGMGWVGENIAYGYATGRAVVTQGWMKSDGHRANILSDNYELMGLGAVRKDGVWWVSQVFGTKQR